MTTTTKTLEQKDTNRIFRKLRTNSDNQVRGPCRHTFVSALSRKPAGMLRLREQEPDLGLVNFWCLPLHELRRRAQAHGRSHHVCSVRRELRAWLCS
jgi:hypothetical protein